MMGVVEAAPLLPCPFCGAQMEQHPQYPAEYRHAYKRVVRCPAGATVVYLNDDSAVAWNRRTAAEREADLQKRIDGLEAMLGDGQREIERLREALTLAEPYVVLCGMISARLDTTEECERIAQVIANARGPR